MTDEAFRDLCATKHAAAATPSIGKMEQAIADLEARLMPAERLEYYECVAQGEPRFDALSAILSTR